MGYLAYCVTKSDEITQTNHSDLCWKGRVFLVIKLLFVEVVDNFTTLLVHFLDEVFCAVCLRLVLTLEKREFLKVV